MNPDTISSILKNATIKHSRSEFISTLKKAEMIVGSTNRKSGHEHVIPLYGPFKPVSTGALNQKNVKELEVHDLIIDNDEFARLSARLAGVQGPLDEADINEFKGPSHTLFLYLDFYEEKGDMSVGLQGGVILEGWELLAIDDIALENSDDIKNMEVFMEEHYVSNLKEDWEYEYSGINHDEEY